MSFSISRIIAVIVLILAIVLFVVSRMDLISAGMFAALSVAIILQKGA